MLPEALMTDPRAALIHQFHEAASSEDPRSAEAWSTPAGWRSRADSAARLARQIHRDGVDVRVTGPALDAPDGSRSAVRTDLMKDGKAVDSLFVLLERDGEDWRVEAVAQDRTLVGLFLAGTHSPVTGFEDLPDQADARAWGEARLAALQSGEHEDARLARFQGQGMTELALQGVYHLAPIGRSAVVLEARRPGEDVGPGSATILQHTDEGVVVVAEEQLPGMESLLDGVQADWELPEATGSTSEARAEALIGGLLDQLLGALGFRGALPEGGARPVLQFLTAEAQAGRLPTSNLLDPQHMGGVWSGDLAGRVERHVQRRIGEILGKHGVDPDQVDPDSEAGRALVADHAEDIVRGLFQGVLLASAPGDQHDLPEGVTPSTGRWMRAALRHIAETADQDG